jgi:hypothetical protein
MALTDSDFPHPALEEDARARSAICPPPTDPLIRLAQLHDEARRNLHTARFLARSPQATLVLMGAAALVLALDWAKEWGSLRAGFAWSLLLLAGIVGMTGNFIRGFARRMRRIPLETAASDLCALLLYCGTVWGAGVLLVLPPAPPPLLAAGFALLPALALSLLLTDEKGATAFTVPVTVMTAGAAHARFWPHATVTALAVLAAGAAIAMLPVLIRRHKTRPMAR